MSITNTGAVERTITGVNESDLFLDESSSTVNNTGAVERAVSGVNDSQLFEQESTSIITNTGVIERSITGVNYSNEMFPDNTESNITNLSEGSGNEGGGGGASEEEEADNEISNGRLNTDASGYILAGGWSYDNGALLHSGASESLLLINKDSLSGNNHFLRFEVKAGVVTIKDGFHGGTDMLNPNGAAGDYGVGVHEIQIQPLNWGTPQSVPVYSSTDGTILDNIFLQEGTGGL